MGWHRRHLGIAGERDQRSLVARKTPRHRLIVEIQASRSENRVLSICGAGMGIPCSLDNNNVASPARRCRHVNPTLSPHHDGADRGELAGTVASASIFYLRRRRSRSFAEVLAKVLDKHPPWILTMAGMRDCLPPLIARTCALHSF